MFELCGYHCILGAAKKCFYPKTSIWCRVMISWPRYGLPGRRLHTAYLMLSQITGVIALPIACYNPWLLETIHDCLRQSRIAWNNTYTCKYTSLGFFSSKWLACHVVKVSNNLRYVCMCVYEMLRTQFSYFTSSSWEVEAYWQKLHEWHCTVWCEHLSNARYCVTVN